MLLVTFHGGSSAGSINNVFAYATSGPNSGALLTNSALAPPGGGSLSELRAMTLANGHLYVANGARRTSNVLCYSLPPVLLTPPGGLNFTFLSTVVAATFSDKGHFETAIAHPFGIAAVGDLLYVSNQDTNVVAQVSLANDGENGALGQGCQSKFLSKLFPPAAFLDGTFVASQIGKLHDVKIEAPDVPKTDGGLGVAFNGDRVQNSARDVAIANDILFVCDEPDHSVNMYALPKGAFLSASASLATMPTHLTIYNSGLWVSAGPNLFWGQLPVSAIGAQLTLQRIASFPQHIGGIAFDNPASPATLYFPLQISPGGANGGSIQTCTVTQSSPATAPTLSNQQTFVASGPDTFQDTPEFVLYLPD
jgi:hypothetical protein